MRTAPLEGRVALVTGASRGVGSATAVALARAGCAVACAARATAQSPMRLPGTLDDTVARIRDGGGDAVAVPTNLAYEEEVVEMVGRTVEHFGRLDLLVNNAAITFVGDLDIPRKRYELVMAVNLRAPMVAIREAAPHLRAAAGSVVNVSSAASLAPVPGLTAYGMSKIALEHLTLAAARELHDDRICVNAFRIDVAVASEGFVANTPAADHDSWLPTGVAAEGIVWMLSQPFPYTGQLESMLDLAVREGIMEPLADRAAEHHPPRRFGDPWTGLPSGPVDFVDG